MIDLNGISLRYWIAVTVDTRDLSLPSTLKECAEYLNMDVGDYNGRKHWYQILARERLRYADTMIAEMDWRENETH